MVYRESYTLSYLIMSEMKYSLGAAETIQIPFVTDHAMLDGIDYPIAIYKFKYRSNGKALTFVKMIVF